MEYFNPKEDVLDFKLTDYGVKQLRDGKYNPEFYAFFDDGVVYDGDYTGNATEEQNDIETRILTDTPYVKTVPRLIGVEAMSRKIDAGDEGDYYLESEAMSTVDSIGKYSSFLGQSNVPRWKVYSINGEFDSANIDENPLSTKQNLVNMNIPQVPYDDVEYEWEPVAQDINNESEITDNVLEYFFEDGSGILVSDDYILLDIQELGTDFEKQNFDITLYEVEEGSGLIGEENKLKPLWFFKNTELVKDGILLDESDIVEYDEAVLTQDSDLVDYYLDVLVDQDIPDDKLCDYFNKDNDNNNIYLRDSGMFSVEFGNRSCEDNRNNDIENQYDVRREDDLGNEC